MEGGDRGGRFGGGEFWKGDVFIGLGRNTMALMGGVEVSAGGRGCGCVHIARPAAS
jgi:hypothetical protein